MIQVENLVKRYGNHLAVDHLNFTIEKGKIYGFLGPNGAGKSTTMNIMTGYLAASEGRVIIDGHDILQEPEEAKRRIGYLPELPPLYMEMTVLEYLEFAAELKKIPIKERENQLEKIMEMVQLLEVKDRLIQNLSKGYRQRVGLAQAILGFPEIIILDEPTVGLDPKQIIEIRSLIRKLAEQHTVILSSHILAEVREVCDEIIIIANGKLVASDTPERLEESLGEGGYIEIESPASRKKIEEILSRIEEILSCDYETEENGDRKLTRVKITCKGNADIREKLFFAFAEQNLPLLTMMRTKSSLEDVFLELTRGSEREEEGLEEASKEKVKEERAKEEIEDDIQKEEKEGVSADESDL